MKCLTLTQPYATLVAIGAKAIETRSWPTKYRGIIAIHAAKGFGGVDGKAAYLELCTASEPIYAALERAGLVPFTWNIDALMALPRGAIIAVCSLTGCFATPDRMGAEREYLGGFKVPPDEPECYFGDHSPGRFAWRLEHIKPLKEPIPAKGSLGLWEYDEATIRAQL